MLAAMLQGLCMGEGAALLCGTRTCGSDVSGRDITYPKHSLLAPLPSQMADNKSFCMYSTAPGTKAPVISCNHVLEGKGILLRSDENRKSISAKSALLIHAIFHYESQRHATVTSSCEVDNNRNNFPSPYMYRQDSKKLLTKMS
ncbi:hypothetical protein XENTR_v10000446 [Xenopus tropicalis]|nr:hypothetical protein XENTR_v10000446 [Xenopus tropicalis]